MRFMSLYAPDPRRDENAPPDAAEMARVGALIQEMADAGVLITTEGLKPSATGAIVTLADGELTIIDGPFAEAKELIGGYAIIDVKSKVEALQWAERFLSVMGGGTCEVRQMYEPADFAS